MRISRPPWPSASLRAKAGGAEGIRTPDPHNAIVVLYQLSYDPSLKVRQFTERLPITQGKSKENQQRLLAREHGISQILERQGKVFTTDFTDGTDGKIPSSYPCHP